MKNANVKHKKNYSFFLVLVVELFLEEDFVRADLALEDLLVRLDDERTPADELLVRLDEERTLADELLELLDDERILEDELPAFDLELTLPLDTEVRLLAVDIPCDLLPFCLLVRLEILGTD